MVYLVNFYLLGKKSYIAKCKIKSAKVARITSRRVLTPWIEALEEVYSVCNLIALSVLSNVGEFCSFFFTPLELVISLFRLYMISSNYHY